MFTTSLRRSMTRRIWLVLVMAMLSGETLIAQSLNPEIIAGAAAAMSSNHEATDFPFFPTINACGKFSGGNGGLHWGFSAFADVPFSRSSNFLSEDYPSW